MGKAVLSSVLLLFTLAAIVSVSSAETVPKPCGGRTGVICRMDCQDKTDDIQYPYLDHGFLRYEYRVKTSYTACSLQDIQLNGTYSSTNMDLSGLSLSLDRIQSNVFDQMKKHILSLDLSGNLFCSHDLWSQSRKDNYMSYHPYYLATAPPPSYINSSDIAEQFPSLRILDVSNTLTIGSCDSGTANLGKLWKKKKKLSHLDISNNGGKNNISSDDLHKMVDLKYLDMSQCCSMIHDKHGTLFRDLVSLQTLDVSSTRWANVHQHFLYSMKDLKVIRMTDFEGFLDFSIVFRKQKVLEDVDISSLKGHLDASKIVFSSPKIKRLILKNNDLYNFDEMQTSFGLPNPLELEELDLSHCSLRQSQPGSGPFPEDISNLRDLNLRGSSGFIDSLNTPFLQNHKRLKTLDLSGLGLLGFENNRSASIFDSLVGLETLIMQNTTVRGSMIFTTSANLSETFSDVRNYSGSLCDEDCDLGLIPEIREIDLAQSSVNTLIIDGYSKLETLNLRDVTIDELLLTNLDNLTSLDMTSARVGNARISGFTPDNSANYTKSGFKGLEVLELGQSTFQNLEITRLNNLRKLSLFHSNVINCQLSELESLEVLEMSSCRISNLNLSELDEVRTLDMHYGRFSNLVVSDLKSLTHLDLSHSSVEKISLQNLPKLEKLDLSHSSMEKISLQNLPKLEKMDLSHSTVTNFETGGLPNLKKLDMASVQREINFNELQLERFTTLEDLNLSSARIYDLPDKLLKNMTSLQNLDLSGNFLDSLPLNLFGNSENSRLTSVDLSGNYLRVLPLDDFKSMVNKRSDWTIHLARNLLDCSDCSNSWLSNPNYHFNLRDALCKSPFGKYDISISAAEICN